MGDRLDTLRTHWDDRYATPGRRPLDDPDDGFLDWVSAFDDDRPVLVIGDGEGRNARAVPARHPVTMVELSPVGAAVCRDRSTRPVEIVVDDAFAWLAREQRQWPLVALLYLQPLTESELDVLIGTLTAAVDAGGGCYVEQARAGLPRAHENRMAQALGIEWVDVSRPGDPVERLRLEHRGPAATRQTERHE